MEEPPSSGFPEPEPCMQPFQEKLINKMPNYFIYRYGEQDLSCLIYN